MDLFLLGICLNKIENLLQKSWLPHHQFGLEQMLLIAFMLLVVDWPKRVIGRYSFSWSIYSFDCVVNFSFLFYFILWSRFGLWSIMLQDFMYVDLLQMFYGRIWSLLIVCLYLFTLLRLNLLNVNYKKKKKKTKVFA